MKELFLYALSPFTLKSKKVKSIFNDSKEASHVVSAKLSSNVKVKQTLLRGFIDDRRCLLGEVGELGASCGCVGLV